MKKEQLEKVQAEVSAWAYLNQLSPIEKNFRLKMLMREEGDTFQIYSYENEDLKRSVMIYYHEETKEYKLMITIGLTQFCAIEYISADLAQLEKILRERFDNLLGDISSFNEDHMSIIIKEKKIMQWDYIDKLPQEICGFRLFINPREPVKVINGSYIIIDYCDFAAQSNFIIYYNVFRDEFFGEAKIHRIPEITYEFDSSELKDLRLKLEEKLENTLKQLRARI
ncbi:hypothetical protein [Megamonas hypermegale]|uniref:hypothetical protein n=1 Tax=Megamonas hypermegale TaxID=158847 RepID=UPI0025A4A790|nr:hypothetical protein [Megamonas hypermegale]MDM8142277.1 hypothetical protein [Megamonas hypermegale]